MNIRVADLHLPEATSTPSGMPDVTTAASARANAELFWHMLRETIKRYDPPPPTCMLPGTKRKGFILRESPAKTAGDAWDGLDGSGLAMEILEVLYENLIRSGHMGRWTVGGKAVRWWVADSWDKVVTYPPVTLGDVYAKPEEMPVKTITSEPVLESAPVPAFALDYHAVLQGLLDEVASLRSQVRQQNTAATLGEDVQEMAAEIERLRARCEDLTTTCDELRRQKLAYDRVLGRR